MLLYQMRIEDAAGEATETPDFSQVTLLLITRVIKQFFRDINLVYSFIITKMSYYIVVN